MSERGSEISFATVLIIFILIPSYPGLFCEFRFFISASTSNFVTGLIKKLSLHLLKRYSLKVLSLFGSFLQSLVQRLQNTH